MTVAKPYVHAESSAAQWGGPVAAYLAVHDLMDWSKSAHASVRHRAVFHSADAGLAVVRAVVGDVVPGTATPTALVVDQHCREDLGFLPPLALYLERVVLPPGLDRKGRTVGQHCAASARRFGGVPADYEAVHRFMDLPAGSVGDEFATRSRLVLHHAFGCFVAERAFGHRLPLTGGGFAHTRDVAERHVIDDVGHIPSLGEWLAAMAVDPWMAGARKPPAGRAAAGVKD